MREEIKIDELAQKIQRELGIYSEEVTQIVKRQADLVATEAVKELRDTSPKRTGGYAKDWTKKTGYESTRTKRNMVYNRGHYQLTHLLENGHAKRGGGRVAGTVQWFTDRYNDTINAFKEIPNFFKRIFDDAWENIKGAFSGVIDFFTGIRDTIMGFFNGIADAIRGEIEDATDATKKGTGESSKSRKATPEFARGGILRSGRGIVAEAGPELIEMVNGAAIITPLGNRATNTPITATNGADSGLQQVFHFHSPKALDPYETARLARNATRGAVLKLQGV